MCERCLCCAVSCVFGVLWTHGETGKEGRKGTLSVDGYPTRGRVCVHVPIQAPRSRFGSARKWVFENIKTRQRRQQQTMKKQPERKEQSHSFRLIQSSGLAFPFLLCGSMPRWLTTASHGPF